MSGGEGNRRSSPEKQWFCQLAGVGEFTSVRGNIKPALCDHAVKLNQTSDPKKLKISYWGRFLTYNALGWGWLAVTVAFYLARPITTLVCYRVEPTQINCDISRQDFPFQSLQRQKTYALRNVMFEPLNGTAGNLDQIVLTSKNDRENFLLISSSNPQEIQQSVTAIAAFEEDTAQANLFLTIKNSPGAIAKLVLGIWAVTGASLVLAAALQPIWVDAWVDVSTQVLHLRYQYVLKRTACALELSHIAQISQKTSSTDEGALHRVVITLKSGEAIDLGFFGSSDKQASALKIALNSLLN